MVGHLRPGAWTFWRHVVLMVAEIQPGSLLMNHLLFFHELDSISDQFRWHSCSYCNISSMQIHVAFLDSFDTEGTQGC